MDVSEYVGKVCKIELLNNFYYEGKILSNDSDSLVILDKKGQKVTLSLKSIVFIKEVLDGTK